MRVERFRLIRLIGQFWGGGRILQPSRRLSGLGNGRSRSLSCLVARVTPTVPRRVRMDDAVPEAPNPPEPVPTAQTPTGARG